MQQSKLDNIVNLQLHEINKRGRGFVLDIAASSREKLESVRQFLLAQEGLLDDGAKIDRKELLDRIAEAIDAVGQTSIEVREALKPVDEYVKPADGRGHVIGDTDSFIDYAKKYGDAEKSLIFYNDEQVTLTIDETVERGEREIVKMAFETTDEWDSWSGMLGVKVPHKQLFRHIMLNSHTLEEPAMLEAMRRVKTNAQVDTESDLQNDSKTLGVMIKNSAGKEMAKFPREIELCVPVLDQDLFDPDRWASVTVNVDIQLPDDPRDGITFMLHCSKWGTLLRERTRQEATKIARELDGFTVVRGQSELFPRRIGRGS